MDNEPSTNESHQQPDDDHAATEIVAPHDEPQKQGCVSRLLMAGFIFLLIAAAAIWFTLSRAQVVPEFYAKALRTDVAKAEVAGKEFERNLIRLQNRARIQKPWVIEITEEQVNGWFISDLPEKFPESLPADISDPRAVFTPDEIRIAFKYTVRNVVGVVVISANTFCTDKPNEIALQINSVKTGFLPLPIGPWLQRVADSIRKAGIPVFWSHSSSVPTAIFTLPEQITTTATNHVKLEAIDVRTDKIVIAGSTIKTRDERQQARMEKQLERKKQRAQDKKKIHPPKTSNESIQPGKFKLSVVATLHQKSVPAFQHQSRLPIFA
jgi:hypothetical protein